MKYSQLSITVKTEEISRIRSQFCIDDGVRPVCPFCKVPFANSDALIDHILLTRNSGHSVLIDIPSEMISSNPVAPAVVAQTVNVSDEHSTRIPNISNTHLVADLVPLSPPFRNSGIGYTESIFAEILSIEQIKIEHSTHEPDMTYVQPTGPGLVYNSTKWTNCVAAAENMFAGDAPLQSFKTESEE